MNRLRLLFLMLIACVAVGINVANAQEYGERFEFQGLYYKISSSNKAKLASQNDQAPFWQESEAPKGAISIPEKVSYKGVEYSVTYIDKNALSGCTALTSVTIPNSVTGIGDQAFERCTALTSVTIPNTVTGLPTGVFKNCTALTDFNIPNSIQWLGREVFLGCTALTSITIPNSVVRIGREAFAECSALQTITSKIDNPQNLEMGENLFTNIYSGAGVNKTTCTLNVPVGSKALYEKASQWDGFKNIVEVNYPIVVGDYFKSGALYYRVTSISPYQVETIYDYAHRYTPISLAGDVTVPEKVTFRGEEIIVKGIGEGTFADHSRINAIQLPNTVTRIEKSAFSGCNNLTKINIPKNVNYIGESVFNLCRKLVEITSAIEDPTTVTLSLASFWGGGEGNTLDKTKCLLLVPKGKVDIYKNTPVWNEFKQIMEVGIQPELLGQKFKQGNLYYKVTSLSPNQVIVTPQKETKNAWDKVWEDESAKPTGSIDIPQTVSYEGNEFTVIAVGDNAFYECSGLTAVTIPNGVTSIGGSAFYKCSGLTAVTIPNGVTSIGGSAFYKCSGLTAVTIPNSVTYIGRFAFFNCSHLSEVQMSNSVKTIEGSAFFRCAITSIQLPATLTAMGGTWNEFPFAECYSLKSIDVDPNNSVYASEEGVLFNKDKTKLIYCPTKNKNSTEYTIPSSVHTIGTGAFTDCAYLRAVTIPNSVTTIEKQAFLTCFNLTEITIPASVTSIGSSIFSGCKSLTRVTSLIENLTSVKVHYNAFLGFEKKNCTLIVPDGKIDEYKNNSSWKGFKQYREISEKDKLVVSPTDLTFTSNGGTQSIDIKSNTKWTIKNSAEWLTLSESTGENNATLTLRAAANTTIHPREASITITAGELTQTISVTQEAVEPELSFSDLSHRFTPNEKRWSVTVTSNGEWTATTQADWITLSATTGESGETEVEIEVTLAEKFREGSVTFTCGNKTAELSILQDKTPTLEVTPNELCFTQSGGSQELAIKSNSHWRVKNPARWLTLSDISGSKDGVITVTAKANDGTAPRSATITITAGELTKTITVTQEAMEAPTLTVTPSELNFATTGEEKTISITSNRDWTATAPESWISLSATSGSKDGVITVTAKANDGTAPRSATITITAGELTKTITVTQEAMEAPTLTVTPSELNFATTGEEKTISITSNRDWTATAPESWISLSATSGSKDGVITVTATANAGTAPRSATITITAGELTKTVTVKQSANNAVTEVSTTDTEVWSADGTLYIRSKMGGADVTAHIFTIEGSQVASLPLQNGINSLALVRGTYLVCIGSETYKVVIL